MTLSNPRFHVVSPSAASASSIEAWVWVAELHRLLALELDRVDGSDHLSTGELGPLHCVGADTADADDRHGVAGLDLRRMHRRAPARHHAAAEEARTVERDVLVDDDAARLVDDPMESKRAKAADAERDVLAPRMVPRRAVAELHSGGGERSHVAQVAVAR